MPEPLLPASFEWIRHAWGRTLQCRPLAAVAQHAFTTRELPLPAEGDRSSGWGMLADLFGVPPDKVVTLHQVHGAHVFRIPHDAAAPVLDDGTWGEGDGLVSDDGRFVLAVKAADCVPVLLADRGTGAVGAVHAGWRGTAAGAAAAGLRAMMTAFGTKPADVLAAIGPSIGPCCYEVGMDVFDVFLEAGHLPDDLAEWFSIGPREHGSRAAALENVAGRSPLSGSGKVWLDTWQSNADQLVAAGVPRDQVFVAALCTSCHRGLLHSYRVDGKQAGRMVGAIRGK